MENRIKEIKESLGFTPRTKKVLENAFLESKRIGYNFIGTEHMLIGLLKESECIAVRILEALNIKVDKIYTDIANILNDYDTDTKSTKEEKKHYCCE